MKKPTVIIGKKQIILACLTLILGIAVYLNYAFSGAGLEFTTSNAMTSTDSTSDAGENYGDAEFVSAEQTTDFFAQARIDKMTKRDEAVQTLQAMLGGGDLTEDEMTAMQQEAVQVSKLVESENVVESLVKAQGFQDCIVYLDNDSAKIVVKTNGLIPAEAAQIKDALLSEIQVPAENITIFEVK